MKKIDARLARIEEIEKKRADLAAETLRVLQAMQKRQTDTWRITEGVQLALTQEDLGEVEEFSKTCVLDFATTLRRIAEQRLNFARFGDGEFRAMLNEAHDLKFQTGSPALQAALRSVLAYGHEQPGRLLLGFPLLYRTPHWQKLWSDVWPRLSQVLPRDIEYGNAHVTRPVFFKRLGHDGVQLWRDVWERRDVCVITGKGSRFTMNPNLFDGIDSVDFLHSTPTDAYNDIERLIDTASSMNDRDLFLISLGPAGTVLTAELTRRGMWAIDIGHLSASYEQVFEGAETPEHR